MRGAVAFAAVRHGVVAATPLVPVVAAGDWRAEAGFSPTLAAVAGPGVSEPAISTSVAGSGTFATEAAAALRAFRRESLFFWPLDRFLVPSVGTSGCLLFFFF